MQRLKFINSKGKEFVFNSTPPFIFWKLTGTEMSGTTPITTQSINQSGYTLHGVLLEARQISVTGHIHGTGLTGGSVKAMYEKREQINSICNPILGLGVLIYENDNGVKSAPAFCSGITYAEKSREFQTLSLKFTCPSPYWEDVDNNNAMLSFIGGGMGFPLNTPTVFGNRGYIVTIENDSDVETPMIFDISGGAKNPIITNITTGRYIKYSNDLAGFERLYINTDPENLEVSKITLDPATNREVKENAFGYLSGDSSFLTLQPGLNQLTYKSDDDNLKVKIRIYYKRRYVGL